MKRRIGLSVVATLLASATLHLVRADTCSSESGTLRLEDRARSKRLHVKFKEGSGVRFRDGVFLSLGGEDVSILNEILRRQPILQLERICGIAEDVLEKYKIQTEKESGLRLADLNLFYRIVLQPGSDAEAVASALKAIPIVVSAYLEPPPAASPIITPNFEAMQGYLNSPPEGVGAPYGWDHAQGLGGAGEFAKIIDIEYAWNDDHEDLTSAHGALIPNCTQAIPQGHEGEIHHGTGVLGEMSRAEMGLGSPGSHMGRRSTWSTFTTPSGHMT